MCMPVESSAIRHIKYTRNFIYFALEIARADRSAAALLNHYTPAPGAVSILRPGNNLKRLSGAGVARAGKRANLGYFATPAERRHSDTDRGEARGALTV